MKVTIEFNNNEEAFELESCIYAYKMRAFISDYASYLRTLYKHDERCEFPIEEIREQFYEMLNDNGISPLF